MNLQYAIQHLCDEKAKLDRAIAVLVDLQRKHGGAVPSVSEASKSPKGRGRRSMGDEERREVSARMKKYWASRRQALGRSNHGADHRRQGTNPAHEYHEQPNAQY